MAGESKMKFLITGVCGFIGSYFAKYVIQKYPEISIIGNDRNANQRNLARLEDLPKNSRFNLVFKDLARDNFAEEFTDVDYVFNFGAETHVDYSIQNPEPFIESNIVGTYKLLEEAKRSRTLKTFFQFSTDEVYGAILSGSHTEESPSRPSNPYAATKESADALAYSYFKTYGLPVIITRGENHYGPWQGKEKVFPTFVRKALNNEPLPIYGDGKHIRQWLHVDDSAKALMHLIEKGKIGEIYNIGGKQELENLELAKRILRLLGKPEDMIEFIPDFNIRPGHDRRYALNTEKIEKTGWKPQWDLNIGISYTVDWYKNNQWWFM